jgi:hypothetical protein
MPDNVFRCGWFTDHGRYLVGSTDWAEPYDYPWDIFYTEVNSALKQLCHDMPNYTLVGRVEDGIVVANDLICPNGKELGPDSEVIFTNYGIPFRSVDNDEQVLDAVSSWNTDGNEDIRQIARCEAGSREVGGEGRESSLSDGGDERVRSTESADQVD